jgi:hypothetical protein
MHPLCMAIRTHNVLSHPPGVKPQRPSPEIRHTPAIANLQYTSTAYKNTHRHSFNAEYMHEKMLLFILMKIPLYKGVPEHGL